MLDDLLDTFCREEVHVVFCGVPGEKCMNDDFEVYVKPGRIIAATLAPTPQEPRTADTQEDTSKETR